MQKLLNEKQVSELTGRAVTTLQKDRLKGTGLKYVRLGRLVRYRPEERWTPKIGQSCKVGGTTEVDPKNWTVC